MECEVHPGKLKGIASNERDIAKGLNSISDELDKCCSNLEKCLSSKASYVINKAIKSVDGNLKVTAEKIGIMGNKLDTISEMYSCTEGAIAGKMGDAKEVNDVVSGSSEKNSSKGTKEALDEINKILKGGGEILDNKEYDALTAFLALVLGTVGVKDATDIGDLTDKMLGYSGSYLKFGSKVTSAIEKLVEKYGSEELQKWIKSNEGKDIFGAKGLGTAGSMISLIEKSYKAANGNESWQGAVREFSDSTSDVMDLYADLMGLTEEAKDVFKKGDGSGYAALFSIGLYALGNEKKHEGNYTWQDVAELWMGSGMAGASSMISGASLGIVNLDTQGFIDHVNEHTDYVNSKIVEKGGPMWAMACESVLCGPGVAIWSLGDTVMDDVAKKYNAIKDVVNLFT